ncbi:MAG TPA: FtsH protease activity modulator HflK [Candidatus Tenderia electrophaga]|uniref:Protein HflK n=1 Tax=Candidatus Tenderia electrophaga TaxID=1748243 RepID=A0A832J9M2_9GAMM|nr:FtsH protease activity modulator HflK [Candidatus Tenderia electrophaga]
MAWNEPGGSKDNDPWGNKRKDEQGPPDLDEVVRKMQDKLGSIFGGKKKSGNNDGGGSGPGLGKGGAAGMGLTLAVAVGAWLVYDMAHIIQPAEQGVVLRFGKYVDTLQPGLSFRLPRPIEQVVLVDVAQNRDVLIGYRSAGGGGRTSSKSSAVVSESLMLTRDENIVDVSFAIQYNIKSSSDYLFKVRDPDLTLREAAESAIREVVGKSDMDFVLKEGRSDIVGGVQKRIQEVIDNYQTGLMVISVNMQDAQPPEQVQYAFDDAVKAREDQQRLINESQAYSNDILPRARGAAARQIEEASGYKEQVVAQAEGEAARFESILAEYQRAPEVTRQRLYIETMEEVLSKSTKVMIDVEGGNNLMYLPLDRLMQQGQTANQGQSLVSPSLSSGLGSQANSAARSAQQFIKRERDSLRSREQR